MILRSLWSSDEVFGRHISEELRLLGSAEGGSSTERLFTSAGHPAFQKALEKSMGKIKRKKKKCIQTIQVLVNSQTSGNRFGFFCFILYCLSDSFSAFSFYYTFVFSLLEGLHPSEQQMLSTVLCINLLLHLGLQEYTERMHLNTIRPTFKSFC